MLRKAVRKACCFHEVVRKWELLKGARLDFDGASSIGLSDEPQVLGGARRTPVLRAGVVSAMFRLLGEASGQGDAASPLEALGFSVGEDDGGRGAVRGPGVE